MSEDIDLWRIFLVNGLPYRELVERNGRPPSAETLRKHEEELNKLKRETPAQQAERLRRRDAETTSLVQELPKAFDCQAIGDAMIGDRPAYVLHATPHSGYRAQGKYGKMFSQGPRANVGFHDSQLAWSPAVTRAFHEPNRKRVEALGIDEVT